MVATPGDANIRGENIERAVKGFALQQYKMEQLFLGLTSSNWTETFYQETPTELTGGTSHAIKGVDRLSPFPYVEPSWTKVQGRHVKYAGESVISVEDNIGDAIDVQARVYERVTRSVTSAYDNDAYDTLSAASGIGTGAASATWDNATVASRDPIFDILTGIQKLDESNYDALEGGFLLVNPIAYKNLMSNSKVINNPSFKTADVVSNGRVGQVCGLTILKSNSVNDDEAMVIIGQRAATCRTAVPLRTAVIEDAGIKFTIRAWRISQFQITDPKAIYTITNVNA